MNKESTKEIGIAALCNLLEAYFHGLVTDDEVKTTQAFPVQAETEPFILRSIKVACAKPTAS